MNKNQEERIAGYLTIMSDTLYAKGNDYSGEEDTLANFKELTSVGVSPELHIFTRITDKFCRIRNYFSKGGSYQVKESVKDSLLDLANYCLLFCLVIDEKGDNDEKS